MKIINVAEAELLGATVYRVEMEDGTEWFAPLNVDGEMRQAIDRFFSGKSIEPFPPPSNAPQPLTL